MIGTRAAPVATGVRKAPAPQGLPGYIRIDTVHQGDQDGMKGVYHINAVDIVTQWELVASVEQISEAYLLPVIALLLDGFPFEIPGFHSDSGSEYVNHKTAELLEKLRIEFTKSRPRQTNDNALAKCKNGAVIRKAMGYSHILKNTRAPSIASIAKCSIPISTSTAPVTSPLTKSTPKERSEKPIHTTRS